jgi:hypothetical protein
MVPKDGKCGGAFFFIRGSSLSLTPSPYEELCFFLFSAFAPQTHIGPSFGLTFKEHGVASKTA